MPSFSLHCDHGPEYPECDSAPRHSIVCTFDAESLSDVLERVEEFLRGCGYSFDGVLDFVDEDETSIDNAAVASELHSAVERIAAAARLCGCEVEVVDLDADDDEQDDAGTTDDD